MTAKPGLNSRTPEVPTRPSPYTVKQQLLGKLGPRGYGRLLERLKAVSK